MEVYDIPHYKLNALNVALDFMNSYDIHIDTSYCVDITGKI